MIRRAPRPVFLVITLAACVGEGVDVTYSENNCPWRSFADLRR